MSLAFSQLERKDTWARYLYLALPFMSSITLEVLLLPNRLNLLFLTLLVIGILGCLYHFTECFISITGGLLISLFCFAAFDYQNCRMTSLIYTCGVVCTVTFYRYSVLHQRISCKDFLLSLRYLVYIFGAAVLIQAICNLLHLPIFNAIGQSEFFIIRESEIRYSSLSYEPAHYSKIIALCLFAHTVICKNLHDGKVLDILKKYIWFYLAGILQLLLTQSSTALVLLLPVLAICFSKRNVILFVIFFLLIAEGIMFWFSQNLYVERIMQTMEVFFSFDIANIIWADGSAAVRIVPYFIYFEDLEFFSMPFWFGHGFDASVTYFTDVVNSYRNYIPAEVGIGGCFVCIPFNYGFLIAILFLWWLKNCSFSTLNFINILFFFLVCYDMGFNTYIFCFASMLFVAIDYFTRFAQQQNQQKKEDSI